MIRYLAESESYVYDINCIADGFESKDLKNIDVGSKIRLSRMQAFS